MLDYNDVLDVVDMIFEFSSYPTIGEIARECSFDKVYTERMINYLVERSFVFVDDYGYVQPLVDYDTMFYSVQNEMIN